jgi:hypothetical protein
MVDHGFRDSIEYEKIYREIARGLKAKKYGKKPKKKSSANKDTQETNKNEKSTKDKKTQ